MSIIQNELMEEITGIRALEKEGYYEQCAFISTHIL